MHRSLVSRGYTVWIDIEKMQGSTVEAMASAVEGAAVLVYGISSACEYFPPACISLLWYCGTVVWCWGTCMMTTTVRPHDERATVCAHRQGVCQLQTRSSVSILLRVQL